MNLYILRHASAGVRRVDPVVDAKRPLDKEGKEQCLLIGRYLTALRLQFDVIPVQPAEASPANRFPGGNRGGLRQQNTDRGSPCSQRNRPPASRRS